jgi:arylsulfatase A-like enzyme
MKVKKYLLIILFIVLAGLSAGIVFEKYPVLSEKEKSGPINQTGLTCKNCNVIFVSFDDLRAANVHILGYKRKTTSTIDRLAKTGYIFTQAITVAPWTLPSTMSWFTGVYPRDHKITNKLTVTGNGGQQEYNLKTVSPSLITLAEAFKSSGYATGGFTGGAGVDRSFGFDQGFDTYFDKNNFGGFKDSVPQAISWIKEHKNEKMFVFLHGYDIHGQYMPHEGYDERFVDFDYTGKLTGSPAEQKDLREEGITAGRIFLTPDDVRFLTDLYDEKVQRADEQFGIFMQEYEKISAAYPTVFILTSDHGEELYEHGRIDHGHSLYDELLRVPLFIILPGNTRGKTITDQVRSIDIMPTILDITGITSASLSGQLKGVSLTGLMRGMHAELNVFPETDYRYTVKLRGVRTPDGRKLIDNVETNSWELYDLKKDPKEAKNLVSDFSLFRPMEELLLNEVHGWWYEKN